MVSVAGESDTVDTMNWEQEEARKGEEQQLQRQPRASARIALNSYQSPSRNSTLRSSHGSVDSSLPMTRRLSAAALMNGSAGGSPLYMDHHHRHGTNLMRASYAGNNSNGLNGKYSPTAQLPLPTPPLPPSRGSINDRCSGNGSVDNGGSGGVDNQGRQKRTGLVTGAITASVLALILCATSLLSPSSFDSGVISDGGSAGGTGDGSGSDSGEHSRDKDKVDKEHGPGWENRRLYDEEGRYILEDYDAKPPFSDFLPGVAGIYGKPLWAFYVNRGQGISSFGTTSKDYPILEFNSANKAYQNVAMLGFRTFLRGTRGSHNFFVEPFDPQRTQFQGLSSSTSSSSSGSAIPPKRTMYVGASGMQIREVDVANKLEINVTYFSFPEEDYASFVRRTTITNLAEEPLQLDLLDGLARMEPYGFKHMNEQLKERGRSLEGWFGVHLAHEDTITMPFYRTALDPNADSQDVPTPPQEGHYCLAYMESQPTVLLPILYDPSVVFGEDTMLLRPIGMLTKSMDELLSTPQFSYAKTASGFAAVNGHTLEPGASMTVASFYGKANHMMDVPVISRRISGPGMVRYKNGRVSEIINQITSSVETRTANPLFDGHVQQMYMDNSLRGGNPFVLGDDGGTRQLSDVDEDSRLKVYHLFSRKQGDLERDEDDFVLGATFFSQGEGNFPDVIQSRRNDVIFNPRTGAFNVKLFLSLIQADGYEPLVVEPVAFYIRDREVCDAIATEAVGHADGHRAQRESLSGMLCGGRFRMADVFSSMEQNHVELLISAQVLVDRVAASSEVVPMAKFGDGYWHNFIYYMDLIRAYLTIFPDREESLLYGSKLSYYFSPVSVRPRRDKYAVRKSYEGTRWAHDQVFQADATFTNPAKEAEMRKFWLKDAGRYSTGAYWQRDVNGTEVKSSPIAKLLLLVTLKFATRDPMGMGLEFEGGRAGGHDLLGGVVSRIGSGMAEASELEVLLSYIRSVLEKYHRSVEVPLELAELMDEIQNALHELKLSGYRDTGHVNATVPPVLFRYWDRVATARETYRTKVEVVFSGEVKTLTAKKLVVVLDAWLGEMRAGQERATVLGTLDGGDVNIPTYFAYQVSEWDWAHRENKDGLSLVFPREFKVAKFPLFLDGPVAKMKTVGGNSTREIFLQLKSSPLFDEKLSMFRYATGVRGGDKKEMTMGRISALPPGWHENQSIWIHSGYRLYLQLLREGLFDDFVQVMTEGGMLPFVNPEFYGRSLMECSSFLVSSEFEDAHLHGRGFLARLSGSTAEFLSMWILLMMGPQPFFRDEQTHELRMQLVPSLPSWLFEEKKRPNGNGASGVVGGTGGGGDMPPSLGSGSESLEDKSRDSEEGSGDWTLSFKLFSFITVTYHIPRREHLVQRAPKRYEIGLRDGSNIRVDGPSIPQDTATKIRRVVLVDYIDAFF